MHASIQGRNVFLSFLLSIEKYNVSSWYSGQSSGLPIDLWNEKVRGSNPFGGKSYKIIFRLVKHLY